MTESGGRRVRSAWRQALDNSPPYKYVELLVRAAKRGRSDQIISNRGIPYNKVLNAKVTPHCSEICKFKQNQAVC